MSDLSLDSSGIDDLTDLLLRVSTAGDEEKYRRSKRAGAWAFLAAAHLPFSADSLLLRWCAILADLSPAILAQIPELGPRVARLVSAYQQSAIQGNVRDDELIAVGTIEISRRFDELLFPQHGQRAHSLPTIVARLRDELSASGEIVEALITGLHHLGRALVFESIQFQSLAHDEPSCSR